MLFIDGERVTHVDGIRSVCFSDLQCVSAHEPTAVLCVLGKYQIRRGIRSHFGSSALHHCLCFAGLRRHGGGQTADAQSRWSGMAAKYWRAG